MPIYQIFSVYVIVNVFESGVHNPKLSTKPYCSYVISFVLNMHWPVTASYPQNMRMQRCFSDVIKKPAQLILNKSREILKWLCCSHYAEFLSRIRMWKIVGHCRVNDANDVAYIPSSGSVLSSKCSFLLMQTWGDSSDGY